MRQRYSILFIAFFFAISVVSKAQNAPLEFIENKGQWQQPFLFKAAAPGGSIFLENNGFTFVISASDNAQKIHDCKHGLVSQPQTLKFHSYKVSLAGSKKADKIVVGKLRQHYYNYFLGNDSTRWRTKIHPGLNVDYIDVYRGIDMHVGSSNGMVKYDFIVHSGADPSTIKMNYLGVNEIKIRNKKLEVVTSVGNVNEAEPFAYQYINGQRKEVKCAYVVNDKQVSFHFPEGYDLSENLIIDPTVIFSSFSGSAADNWGFSATYDNQGNFYAGGIVEDVGYPVTLGAYQAVFGGGGLGGGNVITIPNPPPAPPDTLPIFPCDIAISKFNPPGSTLLFSTYLGGSDNEQPHSLVVDGNDNLIIAGRTYSSDYPTVNAFDNTYNDSGDIVVTKFNATGTGLLGSTFIGGSGPDGVNISSLFNVHTSLKHNYGDDARSEVLVDNSNNIYVAASTRSLNFPVTGNAYQSNLQGDQDAVVFKLSPNTSNLIWSTYLGGSNNDAAYVLALDKAQSNLYVAGGTASLNFPSTAGTLNSSFQGGVADGFILRFQNGGNYPLQKGTFIGRADYDQCYGIQVDKYNAVYVMGQTLGGTFPVTTGTYSNPGSSQFVMKLDSNLATTVYSTVFGSGNSQVCNIAPVAFLVDTCEQVYISGWGGNSNFAGSTTGMPVTATAAKSNTDGSDFYFIVLSKGATSLLYGSFYGANGGAGEHVDGGTSRFDKNGVIYQGICAGCGGSSAFPTTAGAYSNVNGSGNCNFGALKIAFDFILRADAKAIGDTSGCAPITVSLQNNSIYSSSFLWSFGDGSPDDTSTVPPPHTFNVPGTYVIKLIAFNSNACNQATDTDYIKIIVDSSSISTNFSYNIVSSCDPYEVSFSNTSVFSNTPGSQNFTTFFWDFGDGNTFNGETPPLHTYADTGTYTVTLIMTDTSACNSPDTIQKTFTLSSEYVNAAFTPDSVCIGNSMLLANKSEYALTYTWFFGDGNTSTAMSPTYSFAEAGVYTIMLIAANPGTCNKFDTAIQTVMVWPQPVANFSYDPIIPVPNEPIKFTNLSSDAQFYYWAFGDGTSSIEDHPTHLYKRTDRYKVCLEAKNEFGCLSQVCKFVDAEIYPAIDVPTGFSPNGDNTNDILYVRGAAVETLNFRVYNRWGEKVFETDDISRGWDGNYKGRPQEMESYAWVLDATFVDGTSVHRTGNVTLLR